MQRNLLDDVFRPDRDTAGQAVEKVLRQGFWVPRELAPRGARVVPIHGSRAR